MAEESKKETLHQDKEMVPAQKKNRYYQAARLLARKASRTVENTAVVQEFKDFGHDVKDLAQDASEMAKEWKDERTAQIKEGWGKVKEAPGNMVDRVKKSERFANLKEGAKNAWNDTKLTLKYLGLGVTAPVWAPVYLGYKAAKETGKAVKNGYNAGKTWIKDKKNQLTSWVSQKMATGWKKLKESKFGRGVAAVYNGAKTAVNTTVSAVKTSAKFVNKHKGKFLVAGAAIGAGMVTGGVGAAAVIGAYGAYKGGQKANQAFQGWVNRSAATMDKLDALQKGQSNKSNEILAENAESNVNTDEINKGTARGNETPSQKESEEAVEEMRISGNNNFETSETALKKSNDQTPLQQNVGQQPAQEAIKKDLAKEKDPADATRAAILPLEVPELKKKKKIKKNWMKELNVTKHEEFNRRLSQYEVVTRSNEGNSEVEFNAAMRLEAVMSMPKEKGGLGLDPKTKEGKEAIRGLKGQLAEKYGIESFKPKKNEKGAERSQSRDNIPRVALEQTKLEEKRSRA